MAVGGVARLGGADEDEDDSIRAAVAAATQRKTSIWDWIEWEAGPCATSNLTEASLSTGIW